MSFKKQRDAALITLQPSFAAIEQCKQLSLPISPLQVRAVRIKLDNGETEILLTSLMDKDLYP